MYLHLLQCQIYSYHPTSLYIVGSFILSQVVATIGGDGNRECTKETRPCSGVNYLNSKLSTQTYSFRAHVDIGLGRECGVIS